MDGCCCACGETCAVSGFDCIPEVAWKHFFVGKLGAAQREQTATGHKGVKGKKICLRTMVQGTANRE